METSDLFAIALIITAIIAVVVYFIAKNNGKNRRISSLLKSHPCESLRTGAASAAGCCAANWRPHSGQNRELAGIDSPQ